MRRPHLTCSLLLALAMPACTWISKQDVDDRRPEVDDDADGFIAAEDCDETNPNINPGAGENWYDSVDQDCGGDDDYDADGDGFVLEAYVGLATAGVEGSGALPSGDCNDNDAAANPSATDLAYDGVDSDCDGRDDFDQDGDGFVASEHEGRATANAPGTGTLPGGDCDDSRADVRPGSTDAWYDGLDQDCAGNDDYDADGDGFVRTEDEGKATAYVPGSGALPAGDCNDSNRGIHPGAADTWYDDIDGDCAGDDDFDKDLDGHRHLSAPEGSGDDCDDDDPSAYPGLPEILGDGVDHDCDGDPDRFLFQDITRLGWTDPRDLRLAANSSRLYLSVAVEQATYGATTYYQSAIALSFDGTDPMAGTSAHIAWLQNLVPASFRLTDGQAFLATDDELVGAVGLAFTSGGQTSLRISGYDLGTGVRFGANSPADQPADFADVAMAVADDGAYHAIGCESSEGVGRYMKATRAGLATSYEISEAIEDLPATACELHFFEAPYGSVLSVQDRGLVQTRFDLRSATPFTDLVDCGLDTGGEPIECPDPHRVLSARRAQDLEILTERRLIVMADEVNDLIVLRAEDGDEIWLSAESPRRVQAHLASSGDLYLAWVDGSGTAWLGWGDPELGMEVVALDVGFTATDAAVRLSVDEGQVFFAAVGEDRIAWGGALLP